MLARLRELAPQIEIALIPSNDVRDLIKREADIAIRHVRPEQGDLTARCVRSAEAHFYASRGYLARAGHPRNKGELLGAEFVGLRPMERSLASLHAQDLPLTPEQFRVTTASGTTLVELVRQGLGIGVLLKGTAKLFPELVPVLPEEVSFPVPFWLVTHRELYTSRRIRLVYDLLAEALTER